VKLGVLDFTTVAMEGWRMFKLPIRTWVRNAAAVFSAQYGSVTEQADDSQCSRETVYEHARKVEERLAEASGDKSRLAQQEAEIQQLQCRIAELEARAQQPAILDPGQQRKFATVAAAIGLSLRQTEDLFGILLPPGQAPDHSTIGRWVKTEAKRAGEVLDVLDRKCAKRVKTLALDEVFFGGDQPWSASNRRA
jgi:ParB-like chromosome segregation protein Spo0J